MATENFSKFDELNIILKEIIKIRNPKTESFNKDLKNVTAFLDYIYKEIAIVISKWESKQ